MREAEDASLVEADLSAVAKDLSAIVWAYGTEEEVCFA